MKVVCPTCQHVGKPAKKKRGSGKLDVLAWMVFPFGLPYSIWRMLSAMRSCRHCGNTQVVVADSPVGKRLISGFDEKLVSSIAKAAATATPPAQPVISSAPVAPPPVETKPDLSSAPVAAPVSRTPYNDPNVW